MSRMIRFFGEIIQFIWMIRFFGVIIQMIRKKNLVIQQKLNQKSILSVEKTDIVVISLSWDIYQIFKEKLIRRELFEIRQIYQNQRGYPNSEIFWWSHGDQNNIQFSKKIFEVLDFCKNWSRSNLYLIFRNFDICLNSWRSEQYLNIEKNFWGFGFCMNWSRLNQYLTLWNWDICLNSLRSEQYPKIGKKIEFGMTDWNSRDQNNIWFSNFEVLMWSHWRQKHIWWS